MPRGCFEEVLSCLELTGSCPVIDDRRIVPKGFRIKFTGELSSEQKLAIKDLKEHDIGVLSAPLGSCKTVMACAMIGHWKKPVLVLVHRQNLLDQWVDRLSTVLDLDKSEIGDGFCYSGNKCRTGFLYIFNIVFDW